MQQENIIKNEKEISYDVLKLIQEHAKKYDESVDKKEFLKNVSAYEQKLILLNSKAPYDVLNYLDELDLKSSRLILSELTYEEISKILELFTAEDKKQFYTTFSDLSLVNQFIVYDKTSSNYIEDLSIDRKVKLLDSSDSNTVLASTKIYESIPVDQRELVYQSISTGDGISALNEATTKVQENTLENVETEQVEVTEVEKDSEKTNEEVEKQTEELEKEEIKDNDLENAKNEFFKSRLQYYKENISGFENLDINDINLYFSLSPQLKEIVDRDFELMNQEKQNKEEVIENLEVQVVDDETDFYDKYSIIGNGERYVSIVSNPIAKKEFDEAKARDENIQIQQIINQIKDDTLEDNIEKTL